MEHIIKHIRKEFFDDATVGRIEIEGEDFCWVLEDAVRETKVPGKTAIPAHKYNVAITYSPKYERNMILVVQHAGSNR